MSSFRLLNKFPLSGHRYFVGQLVDEREIEKMRNGRGPGVGGPERV